MGEEGTTRRSFVGRVLAGTLATGCGAAIASIVAYLFAPSEVRSSLGPRRIKVGAAGDIAAGAAKLVLVDDEPVWVVNLPSGFAAMSALCTHKGCIIQWKDKRRLFSCPCHNGLFDERGNVVHGLPLRPLTRFRVGVVQGDLYVSRGDDRQV